MADWSVVLPLSEMGHLTEQERNEYYANIGEMLEAGMSEEEAACLIYGPPIELPDGTSTILRWLV